MLALDFPGHGRSEGPPIPTVPGMADWVFRVLEKSRIQKAGIVGHSMGSLVALDLAARYPQQVERIALIAVGYPMKVAEPFLEAARNNDYAAIDMHTIWGHAAHAPLRSDPNPGMWMYGDMLARLRRLAPGVLYNDLKACNDYTSDPADVQCPVLLVLGRRDVMTPPRSAQPLLEKLKRCTTRFVDLSGHSLMAEAPDATLDARIEFLRS